MNKLEIPIIGMDCVECANHVRRAIAGVPGVKEVDVYLGAEKAVISYSNLAPKNPDIIQAVQSAGYDVRVADDPRKLGGTNFAQRHFGGSLIFVFVFTFSVVVAGEWFHLFDKLSLLIPWYFWLGLLAVSGFPVFKKVILAALHGQVISHTLMMLGVIAAVSVGEWITAGIVVLFMRIGDSIESFTTDKARSAVRDLYKLAPRTARVEKAIGIEEVPIESVGFDDIVIVRPGESIPVDGIVVSGNASVDQSTITGESIPIGAFKGTTVYSATIVQSGMLKIRPTATGKETMLGKIIRLVEEAEANRGQVQRIADRFASLYLPVVTAISALTYLISRNIMAAAAVLVVACSCSFSLATPIAILASIGSSAKKGLLIKGGIYIERLAAADVLFVDKTGTLTLGEPRITDIFTFGNLNEEIIISAAAAVEKYSRHPLANAVMKLADERGIKPQESSNFNEMPGKGVEALVNGEMVSILNETDPLDIKIMKTVEKLKRDGKTLLFVSVNGQTIGLLAAADEVRSEIRQSLVDLRIYGIREIILLSGDNQAAVAQIAQDLGVSFHAEMMPEEKIEAVKRAQQEGHIVAMVGDGINDAPALAQADVGIAMGAKGSAIAVEAAHIVLLRDDWALVPFAFRTAKRTMRVVRSNIAFTAIYNLIGLSLAAFGILPPVFAAALQSIPDLGILANSARLIRAK